MNPGKHFTKEKPKPVTKLRQRLMFIPELFIVLLLVCLSLALSPLFMVIFGIMAPFIVCESNVRCFRRA